MHDPRFVGAGLVLAEPRGRGVEPGQRAELEGSQVGQPTIDLALVEPDRLAEPLQAPGLPVHPGQLGDAVDQLEGQAPPCLEIVAERRRPGGAFLDGRPTVHELHQVEAPAQDRRVVTPGHHAGMGDIGVGQGAQQTVLAHHRVVASRWHYFGWFAQGHGVVAAGDREEIVGGAAGDEFGLDVQAGAGQARRVHEAGQGGDVETHEFPTSCSRYCAYFFSAAARRAGRCWLGQRPSTGS